MAREPTKIIRAYVNQEAMVLIEPSAKRRRVTLLTPDSPRIYCVLDTRPETIGLNRTYKLPVMPKGQRIPFVLEPEQFLVSAAETGQAEFAIILEVLDA